jgi:hypothetical protein
MATDKDRFLLILVEDLPLPANSIECKKVGTALNGPEAEMIEVLAVLMAHSEKFRRLFNAAGIMANKIRRGEMPTPGHFQVNDN